MSERTVYAIASGKGGVGKTTTAINLGAMLADRGHEVVVVDTDLGMANLADFLEFEIAQPTLHDVLAGDADPGDAVHRAPGDIDVLPSAPDIEAFARSDPANLDGVVDDLRETYDYVLLDTGAGVSYDVLVPLSLADGVLLVATPDVASVRDTAKTGELAERVESDVVGAVLAQRSSDILNADDVEETLGTDVLAVVPQDEAVPMGIDAGRPLAAFAPNAPAGQAYRDLAAVLTGETDPDPELDLDGESDVDVEFDAAPPNRADDSAAEVPANEEMAESVRDAVGRDDSEGLLGGELANVAEEIRAGAADGAPAGSAESPAEQAGKSTGPTDESTGPTGESAESRDGREERGDATDAGGSVESSDPRASAESSDGESDDDEATDESEARSVDDLIDEHMGDDQLAGAGSFGGDDPLAGTGDDSGADDDSEDRADAGGRGRTDEGRERTDEGRGRTDEGRGRTDEGQERTDEGQERTDEGQERADEGRAESGEADPLGAASDAGRAPSDSDPLAVDDDGPAFETESGVESDSGVESGGEEFGGDEFGGEESAGVDSPDGAFEDAPFGSGESSGPATSPGSADAGRGSVGDADASRESVGDADASRRGVDGADSRSAESRGVESGEREAEGVKSGRLSDDEDDDSSGVLGRLGSLFN